MAKNKNQSKTQPNSKEQKRLEKNKLKEKEKLKAFLKNKLNEEKGGIGRKLIADAKAATPKVNLNVNSLKPNQNPNPKKVKNTKKLANQQNGKKNAKEIVATSKTGKAISSPAVNSGESSKNKKKKRKKQQQAAKPANTSKSSTSSSATLSNDNSPVPNNSRKKRTRTVNGFIESNADDEEAAKEVKEKLKTKKMKLNGSVTGNEDNNAPSVVVHTMADSAPDSETGSESEDDSYIDQFFENEKDTTTSMEANGYSSSNSETDIDIDSVSDSASISAISFTDEEQDGDEQAVAHYNGSNDECSGDDFDEDMYFDEFDDLSCEEEESQEEEDDYNNSDDAYFDYDDGLSDDIYEEDSDISYGSDEVHSDDMFDDYEHDSHSSNSDEENSDEYEDHESDSSECGSFTSEDTYDDFMSNKYGKDHDSSDDSDYSGKDECDDLRVAAGTAISYKLTDRRIKLFENDMESRIVELPKSDSEDEKCIELISMNVTRRELLLSENEKNSAKEKRNREEMEKEEKKRLEHEQRVKDYYNSDNASRTSAHQSNHFEAGNCQTSFIVFSPFLKPPIVIQCNKNDAALQTKLVLDESDDNDQSSDIELPAVDASKCTISTVNNTKLKTNKSLPSSLKMNESLPSRSQNESSFSFANLDYISYSGLPSGSEQISNAETKDSSIEDESMEEMEGGEADEMDEMGDDDINDDESSPNANLSKSAIINKGKPKFFNSVNSRHVLLLLRNILYFHGNLHVKLIAGYAEVFGYQLQHNKTVTVHSPRGHSLIYLIPSQLSANDYRPPDNSPDIRSALGKLKSDFYAQDIEFLVNEFDAKTDAILLLERDQSNKSVNTIERYMRETMFPNINAFNSDSPHYSSEFILHCKFSYRPKKGLMLNSAWSSIGCNMNKQSKIVTIGGKGVGKSTFIRYTINSSLGRKFDKFLFIDLDVGQPELFVPQTISATVLSEPILGPGFLKNIQPAKAILFGDINVLPDPIKYIRCVKELHRFCSSNKEYRELPWIINTMGYSRGFGIEIMAGILKIFQPTEVVHIQSDQQLDEFNRIADNVRVNNFKFNIFEEEMETIHERCKFATTTFDQYHSDCGHQKQVDMTSKDLRYTMIFAKLGHCLNSASNWLTSVKPMEASLHDLEIVVTSGEKVDPSNYLDILNGNLVYLCGKRSGDSNEMLDCYGIGIVRSVDAQTDKLYLIPAIPSDELQNVNVLAIGAIPLPSAIFLNQHSQIRGSVPYVYNSDKFVGSKQVVHHIYRPEGSRKQMPTELMAE